MPSVWPEVVDFVKGEGHMFSNSLFSQKDLLWAATIVKEEEEQAGMGQGAETEETLPDSTAKKGRFHRLSLKARSKSHAVLLQKNVTAVSKGEKNVTVVSKAAAVNLANEQHSAMKNAEKKEEEKKERLL